VLLTVHCAAYGGVNSLWSRLVLHISNDNGKFLPEDDPAGSKHVGNTTAQYKPRPQRVHASISGAVHSQQHILTQLYSVT
jgi:ABC-type cobalt transport system substrate-binding protein